MALAARMIKRVTLELGGKSPSLILPDADLDLVIDSVLFRAFFHTGQCCENGTRCFEPRSLYTELIEWLVARADRL